MVLDFQDENGLSVTKSVRHVKGVMREIQRSSILPLRWLDVSHMLENYLPGGCSPDGIHFHQAKIVDWLKKVFQINNPGWDLLESGQFTFGSPPKTTYFPVRPVEVRLAKRVGFRESSASSRSRQPVSTSIEEDTRESSMTQSSVVTSVIVVEKGNENRSSAEGLEGYSKAR